MPRRPLPYFPRTVFGSRHTPLSALTAARGQALSIRSLPQRSQVMRMSHDRNAAERLVERLKAGG